MCEKKGVNPLFAEEPLKIHKKISCKGNMGVLIFYLFGVLKQS